MGKENIHIAILGSLETVQAFGGYISSSAEFANSKPLIEKLGKLDKEFEMAFNSYNESNYENNPQYFLFPKACGNNEDFYFLIRAKKKFTNFSNRFYERREYFFFDLKNEYDTIDFVKSLPVMKQYEESNNGKEIFPKIEKHTYSPDTQISKSILSALLNKDTVKITINSKTQDLILNAISSFPDCYKKYLGFGFNVKDDSFTNGNLHIFSTFDDGAIDIDTLKKSNDKQWNECVDFLLSSKNKYNDIEISKSEINRNTLYKLLDYHKLHYQVDNDKFLDTKEDLKQKTMSYVFDFVINNFTKEEKVYIDERITKIGNFWNKKEVLKQSDLPILFDKEAELKELFDFKDSVFLTIIVELLEPEELEIKLQWKNRYEKVDKKLNVDLKPTANLSEFQLVCNAFIKYYHEKYKNQITDYVQKSIDLDGNREYDFYKYLLELKIKVAKNEFYFVEKISLDKKDITADKDKTLFDLYALFDKKENRNRINNIDNVLKNIAEKIIEEDVNTIKDILKFLPNNKEFLEKYIENFVERITELYNNKELGQEQCVEIFDVIKSIQSTKVENKTKIIQLINTIINHNYYKKEKEKNIIDIEKSNKKYRWIAIFAIVICVFLATLSFYFWINSKTLTETNTAIMEQSQKENNSLKQQLQDYENNDTVSNSKVSVQNGDSIN